MREKFTITPEDEKYMASIGKNLHRPAQKLVSTAQAKTTGLRNRLAGGGKVVGKSHYSGKKYRHD